ncbi:MAG TPA: envelope stress response membrane protein PspB [Aliidongia sp.]|uniref:envelope stress response membrane protein PspB n=1 Tax=Aliidongia sp. TaxID=1914230 RepID=UPI002DDD9D97|nr:envelope stress response membrane protein PspB [Aliidongia sp.]HEV2675702.1 envelope stress response membrane protein PspB [Aliidongia sp.]
MAFHEALGVMGILFAVIVAPIWLFLHYGSRWRQAKLLTTESEKTLAEMADIADRMQSRIENLERLLDATAPDWRKQP